MLSSIGALLKDGLFGKAVIGLLAIQCAGIAMMSYAYFR